MLFECSLCKGQGVVRFRPIPDPGIACPSCGGDGFVNVPEPLWHALGPFKTSDVVGMAKSIVLGRKYGQMPILADALEEAGYTDENVLGTLRRNDALAFLAVEGFLKALIRNSEF